MPATYTVEIHHRATGFTQHRTAEAPDVVLEIVGEEITASELIRRTVSEHLRKLRQENAATRPATAEPLRRLYLTEEEIGRQADSGKIALDPAENAGPKPEPESENFEENAVERALAAFRLGRFTILVGRKQIDDLNAPLTFDDQTKVIFLRLVPLAGG